MPNDNGIPQRARKALLLCLLSCLTTLSYPAHLIASSNTADFHPFATRDQNLFNLIHGQPLPGNAKLNNKKQSLWSSSLVITNTLNIEDNPYENIYLDYEAYRFNLSYQYGINEDWNFKIDIPLIHQSGGVFDSAIDDWHEFFGLPRADRPLVRHNQYDIQYSYQPQTLVDLNEANTTPGDIQLAVARSIIESKGTDMSLWASLKLPTGDKNKLTGNGATDFSAWLALNRRLAKNWLINLNAGAVVLGSGNYKNIPLSDHVLYGHAMLGWLFTDDINIKLQLQGHTSYYDQSRLKILGNTYFLTFGGNITIDQCNQLELAFSEDIKVDASPDASFIISWRSYTSGC